MLDPRYGGSAFDASAGPVPDRFRMGAPRRPFAPPGGRDGAPVLMAQRFASPGGPFAEATTTLTAERRRVHDYLESHRGGARFVAATTSWNTAAPYIMATARPYLPMGGFSGTVPQPTLAAVQAMVARGELHYFLLPAAGPERGFGRREREGATTTTAVTAWVRASCTDVTADVGGGAEAVYRCA
ncbi:hypothetical protein [Dactylosporangium sp. CA-139066]|uniref:hypothetical protein n=1 Tax=Dactylosporangium sp. CA-139066 TaxID=3239930 RepID=UPI003D8F6CE0